MCQVAFLSACHTGRWTRLRIPAACSAYEGRDSSGSELTAWVPGSAHDSVASSPARPADAAAARPAAAARGGGGGVFKSAAVAVLRAELRLMYTGVRPCCVCCVLSCVLRPRHARKLCHIRCWPHGDQRTADMDNRGTRCNRASLHPRPLRRRGRAAGAAARPAQRQRPHARRDDGGGAVHGRQAQGRRQHFHPAGHGALRPARVGRG